MASSAPRNSHSTGATAAPLLDAAHAQKYARRAAIIAPPASSSAAPSSS